MENKRNALEELFINENKELTKEGKKILIRMAILTPILILITKIKYLGLKWKDNQ